MDANRSFSERERGDSTSFDDLNQLLVELVVGAKEILADSFCGAYLQGSFAVGDADAHSDVDFIIVTKDELTPGGPQGRACGTIAKVRRFRERKRLQGAGR